MGIQTVIRTILRKRFAKVHAAYAAIAILTTITSTVLFAVPKALAVATVPTKINFQGRLTDSTGAVVVDGQYNMKFALYDASTGGTLKWNETRETTNRVQVTGGLFSVKLGDVTPISDPTIFSSGNLYFEITLANPATATCSTAGCETWESPMSRNALATSAYAFNSDTLDGLDSTAFAAASGSANYIQNTSSPQTANFNINGTGTATKLQTSTLDTASAGTLTLGGTNATGITLANNTTISAGQSLTIAGGATGTRPASPTEGMVYYDTTTKQLLTYANGKWQGDGKEAIIVAASNSSAADQASADYIATGTGDQTVINSALTAANPAGTGRKTGKVVLLAGTYTINANISVPNNTTLAGVGTGTAITIPNGFNSTISAIQNTTAAGNGSGVIIRDLTLDGNKANQTSGTNTGIYFNGVGSGTGTSAVSGGTITNVKVANWRSYGIELFNSYNNAITGNTVQGNSSIGIYMYSSPSNTITGNTVQGNGSHGIFIYTANYNTVTGNTTQGNSSSGISVQGNSNTVTGNMAQANTTGINVSGNYNTVSGNTIQGSTNGISLSSSTSYNVISANKIHDSGGATTNNGILINGSTNNSITANDITDTSCTGTCYAIQIASSSSAANYLSNNTFSGDGTYAASIYDVGTGTIYSNQPDGNGNLINKGISAVTIGTSTVNGTLSLQGGMTSTRLAAPATPTITNAGTAGTTSYSYTVTALDGTGETIASTAGSTTTGNATLDSTNYNIITWNKVSGAVSYNVYRTTSTGSPATTGKITSSPVAAVGATQTLNDTGLAAGGASPATNTTGGATFAGALQGGSKLTLGTSSNTSGSLVLNNSSNANQLTLTTATQTGNYTLTIPALTANDTICLQTLANCGGAGSGVSTVGALDGGTANANGATISGSTLYLQSASGTVPGLVNTAAQTFAGDKTFSGNVLVAAGKSLSIAGGSTATRPASPTEGMVYYDTTTKQLLTYANGKWQGDGKEAIIVAASNSSAADQANADYVATGASDQTVINNALTAASPSGTRKTGRVILLGGTYTINGSISIPNETALSGVGTATIITVPNADNGSYSMLQNTDTSTGTHVAVSNLAIDGNMANQTSGNMSGIYFSGMGAGSGSSARDGSTITNVWIRNIYGSVGYGLRLVSSNNNSITNNTIKGNGNYGISLETATYNTVTGNTIEGNSAYGLNLSSSSNNTINGNIVQGSGNCGVYLASSSSNTITGNTVQSNNVDGIYFRTSSNNTFSGNTVQGNSADGVYVNGSTNNAFAGNTASGNTQYGFNLSTGSDNNTITANTVQGNGSGGISTVSNYNTISGNKVHDNGGTTGSYGIYVTSGGSYNSVVGNNITDTSCTSNPTAIDVLSSTSTANYLSANTFSCSAGGPAVITDLGTGTVYSNQPDGKGNLINKGTGSLTVGTSTVNSTLSLQGGLVSAQLPAPATPNITTGGAAGITTYSYTVTALDGTGETVASTQGNTAQGNTPLSSTNYNIITWNKVSGAVSYNVYRTASSGSPATTGKINSSPIVATAGATQSFNDTGLAATSSSPTVNTTGGGSFAGSLQAATGLTLGTVGGASGSITLNNTGTNNSLTLVSANQTGNYTLTIPTLTANDTICTVGLANCGGSGTNTSLSNLASTNINAALNATSNNLTLQTTTSGDINMNAAGNINLQSNTTVAAGKTLNLTSGDLQTAGVSRLTGAGQLTNITNYLQSAGDFTVTNMFNVATSTNGVTIGQPTGWTQQTGSGARTWSSIASSSDGTKLAATVNGGYIYTSTDSGVTWTQQTSSGSRSWNHIASSSDGTKLAATVSGGYLYTSSDSGVTWTQTSAGGGNWTSVVSSSDGTKLAGSISGVYIYTSTDSGATWTTQTGAGARSWSAMASSSDGSKLIAAVMNGYIYTSTDSGVTWTQQNNMYGGVWYSVASSGDGTKLAVINNNSYIYTSTDSGVTWTQQTGAGSRNWYGITSSSDGTKLAATVNGGYIYTSTDSGVTWTQQTGAGSRNWSPIISNANGNKVVAGESGGYMYTYSATTITLQGGAVIAPGLTSSGIVSASSLTSTASLTVGTGGSTSGTIALKNSANNNTLTLISGTQTNNYTLTIPTLTANDTVCTVGLANCGATGGLTRTVTLVPEYAGGILHADGSNNSGTITSDSVNGLVSGQGYKHNYYQWTTTNASSQDYDVVVNTALPSEYKGSLGGLQIWAYSNNTTNSTATIQFQDKTGTNCYAAPVSITPSAASTWQQISAGAMSGCTFAANDVVTIDIHMTAASSSIFEIGELSFTYSN